MSWEGAQAYASWLSRKTGKSYHLLSEAEREYVTRAGTSTPFWWGSSISTSQANFYGTDTYGVGKTGIGGTVPVESFAPNSWGLYQVHGNVWDWTEDCWNASYRGAPSDGSASSGGDCSKRVLRGGSWNLSGLYSRSATRVNYSISAPIILYSSIRVARKLEFR
jgi:formylglycine-generating enzyme required for sulfatase activity